MTIVLHHYPMSPFAELVRLALGRKGCAWSSVIIPNILPKPDLVALTGGYARTPVLQIDADIYCDSSAALDALEALPGPTLYPGQLGQAARMIASFAGGSLFLASVGGALGGLPAGAVPQAFVDDRKARMGLDMASLMTRAPHLQAQFGAAMGWLELTLADGRAFIGGDAAGHADFALYMNAWFARLVQAPGPVAILDALPGVTAWMRRVADGRARRPRGRSTPRPRSTSRAPRRPIPARASIRHRASAPGSASRSATKGRATRPSPVACSALTRAKSLCCATTTTLAKLRCTGRDSVMLCSPCRAASWRRDKPQRKKRNDGENCNRRRRNNSQSPLDRSLI